MTEPTDFSDGLNICITGGAGLLGSLLSKRLLDNDRYERVAILSRDWHKQAKLREELGNHRKFRWFIGDIRDKERLVRAFNGIDVVVHAAAFKSVDYGEYNPREILLTNCVGTQNVVEAAIDCGVKKVLFISSDKQTMALNTYGKSKALAESLVIAANAYSPDGTRFAVARYANVLGSSGSVLPIFIRQAKNGVLTVTGDRMSRFWLTPDATVEFVLACIDRMIGGEVFVPRMEVASILEIAQAVAPDAKLEFVGIRPGEKTHEFLIAEEELPRTHDIEWAYRISPMFTFQGGEYVPSGSSVSDLRLFASSSAPRISTDRLKAIVDTVRLQLEGK